MELEAERQANWKGSAKNQDPNNASHSIEYTKLMEGVPFCTLQNYTNQQSFKNCPNAHNLWELMFFRIQYKGTLPIANISRNSEAT